MVEYLGEHVYERNILGEFTCDPHIYKPAVIEELRHNWNREYPVYLTTDHAKKVTDLFTNRTDEWTIDRIVMVGIGYPPDLRQLAMIYHIAFIFAEKKGTNMDFYSQDSARWQDKEVGFRAEFMQACDQFIESLLGSDVLQASDSDRGRPARDLITPTTLLYAPRCGADLIAMLLQNKDRKLYIGNPLDIVYEGLDKSLIRDREDFKSSRVWQLLPCYDYGCSDLYCYE